MKALERVIKNAITAVDPLQFAYRAGRGVDNAKAFILDTMHKHLETPHTTARLLFADFSSKFNTVQPHIIAERLTTRFHLKDSLILWILDFLTNGPQRVLGNNIYSNPTYTSTGSPQGCVLSPLLSHTDECRSTDHNCHQVKFTDDMALLSLLSSSFHHHGLSLSDFVDWCHRSCLEVNVIKTQEMIVTFSKRQREMAEAAVTTTHGEPVEIVERCKYLGTMFDHQLKFDQSTKVILKKCRQWQYFLRKLNSFWVSNNILTFYYSPTPSQSKAETGCLVW